jgi:hypothetical protein
MEGRKYFFSYARNDSEFVLRLAKELRNRGANLWLDQLDILGGERWDHAVEQSLQACEGMIVVLSADAVSSQNVMDEVSYALEEEKLIIPVRYEDCAIPFRLRRVQFVDFAQDFEDGLRALLKALGIDRPARVADNGVPQEPVIENVNPRPKASTEAATGIMPQDDDTGRHESKTSTNWFFIFLILGGFGFIGTIVGERIYGMTNHNNFAAWTGALSVWFLGLLIAFIIWKRKG